ncbi:hypothetical protein ACI2S5_08395 [Ralstonia nicotianae]|uniref:hypothetical protein n=1 Tax=Ralstonia solanacearum species complex TaxID=3116862 RepID=UPI000856F937|nr:hypothetical protein [Ralstonia pseudosolanacearum]AOE89680.1 hypothetical protein LBM341_01392 [Ralstonia solanacearum]KAF3461399.1 hypothetical protein GO278_001966 [Ralstonia solanacearum]MBX9427945.1 hypothetical protein [Ralstonia pseudosolanacearum]MCK4121256.1 hypothetical protein [Ralstonia pseudosolanacearum]MCK4164002.1 hypothetical protein [Ralstonia pseudosolanacearum]
MDRIYVLLGTVALMGFVVGVFLAWIAKQQGYSAQDAGRFRERSRAARTTAERGD